MGIYCFRGMLSSSSTIPTVVEHMIVYGRIHQAHRAGRCRLAIRGTGSNKMRLEVRSFLMSKAVTFWR